MRLLVVVAVVVVVDSRDVDGGGWMLLVGAAQRWAVGSQHWTAAGRMRESKVWKRPKRAWPMAALGRWVGAAHLVQGRATWVQQPGCLGTNVPRLALPAPVLAAGKVGPCSFRSSRRQANARQGQPEPTKDQPSQPTAAHSSQKPAAPPPRHQLLLHLGSIHPLGSQHPPTACCRQLEWGAEPARGTQSKKPPPPPSQNQAATAQKHHAPFPPRSPSPTRSCSLPSSPLRPPRCGPVLPSSSPAHCPPPAGTSRSRSLEQNSCPSWRPKPRKSVSERSPSLVFLPSTVPSSSPSSV